MCAESVLLFHIIVCRGVALLARFEQIPVRLEERKEPFNINYKYYYSTSSVAGTFILATH